MDKRALLELHRAALQAALDGCRAAQAAARAGTRVDGTHRPASRGERAAVTSEGYLAQGLGQRIAELESHVRVLSEVPTGIRRTVANGARITLEDEDGRTHELLVVPGGTGTVHAYVTFVSPASPWVAPFLGCAEGEVADVQIQGRRIEVELVAVA